jgi:hypothetical protein
MALRRDDVELGMFALIGKPTLGAWRQRGTKIGNLTKAF